MKKITEAEYQRLLMAAKLKGNHKLKLIIEP